jgi:hypothetical protein
MLRKKFISVTAVLTLGIVVCAGATRAGTIEIPIFGTQTATETIDPGKEWTDEDGVLHVRGLVMTVVAEGQDMEGIQLVGTANWTANYNIDLATGDGDYVALGTEEMVYGDLTGTWGNGHCSATISGFIIDGTWNFVRCSGDFAGWHTRGTWTGMFPGPTTQWEGVIQIPGGSGADKSEPSESGTWSSVKALYR